MICRSQIPIITVFRVLQPHSGRNSSTSVWETVTVAAAGQTSITGRKFVPKTPELFSYDLDGNLISPPREP